MSFFTGTPGRFEQRSTLGKEQQPLYNQLQQAGQAGTFGPAADYYRSLLSDDNSTYQAMAAPEMRQFREQIIPGLSEQFAGMGSGGLSSSGFRNAAVGAGTDLSERLGAIRAQLRQQGAAGLTGIGQQGLQQYNENLYIPPTQGLLESTIMPLAGMAAGAFGGPITGAIGNLASNWLTAKKKGSTSPYGNEGPTNLRSTRPAYMGG